MGPCSSKSKATIPLGLGKAGAFCPTAVVGKSKGLFGGEPGVGLSRELPCSCLRELAILSQDCRVGDTSGGGGRGSYYSVPPQTTPPRSVCVAAFRPQCLSKLPSSFLQYLKVGETSVKHPVTPSFLTAQGKWR